MTEAESAQGGGAGCDVSPRSERRRVWQTAWSCWKGSGSYLSELAGHWNWGRE